MTAEPMPDPTTSGEPEAPPGPPGPAAEAEAAPAAEAEAATPAAAPPEPPTPIESTSPPTDTEPTMSEPPTADDAAAVPEASIESGTPAGVDVPAVAAMPAVADVPAVAAMPAVAAAAPATTTSTRRSVAIAALRRLVAFILTIALFVGGIAAGFQVFQVTHPPKAAVVGADVPGAAEAPPVAQEFIAALGANDADGLRSSLDVQPHADLTSEFKRFDIQKVTGVETLGTSVDGARSATEILVRSIKTDGLPFDVNLVILVNNDKIEGFR